jgi:hypothetical protein
VPPLKDAACPVAELPGRLTDAVDQIRSIMTDPIFCNFSQQVTCLSPRHEPLLPNLALANRDCRAA